MLTQINYSTHVTVPKNVIITFSHSRFTELSYPTHIGEASPKHAKNVIITFSHSRFTELSYPTHIGEASPKHAKNVIITFSHSRFTLLSYPTHIGEASPKHAKNVIITFSHSRFTLLQLPYTHRRGVSKTRRKCNNNFLPTLVLLSLVTLHTSERRLQNTQIYRNRLLYTRCSGVPKDRREIE